MLIIGCDYHPSFQQIALVDTETGELQQRRLGHREEAEQFYRALTTAGAKVRVGMEASGHAGWFERLLAELNFELWMGDAAKIAAKRVRKQKTDRLDAQHILTLMVSRRDFLAAACGRHVWGSSQSRGTGRHGSSANRGSSFRETTTLCSSRNLSNYGALLNLGMIGLVMWPSFQQQVRPALPESLHKWYFAAATVHALLGGTAELVGLYIVIVAGTSVLSESLRFKHWKRWMRAELTLWAIVVLTGVGTYYAWYIAPFR